ncbi:MAG: TonB-dependent receptor, partial [Alphaproteobacteria bacterium]
VNGHRWIAGTGTRGFRDFVDLNTIPAAIIERVEVLKDGATAIYGADAIAGVINIHTKSDVNGIEANVYGGITSRGDGETYSADLTWGQTFERGSFLATFSYVEVDPIFTEDRALTRVPLNGLSVNAIDGRFAERNTPFGSQRFTRIDGSAGTTPGDFRPFTDADLANTQEGTYVTGPQERIGFYAQGKYDLAEAIAGVFEFLYNNRKSNQRFFPVAPRIRGSEGFLIPADHPFNPFGVEFSGSDFRIDRSIVDNDFRSNEQNVDTFRIGAGLQGAFANGWAWDAFYSYSKNKATFLSRNQIDLDRLAIAIGPNDRCAQFNCVPVNIFGDLTPEMIDFIKTNPLDNNGTSQHDITANLTGEIVDLPAGPLAFAVGVEYREERAFDFPDTLTGSDPIFNTFRRTTSAPREPTEGSFDLKEIYGEFNIPLLRDLPLVRELNVDAAVRFSDYSTFGSTTNLKFGGGWRPHNDVLIRATYAEGFRAPSILELFGGTRATNLPALDPCDGGGSGLPGCAGVPATYRQADFNNGAVLATVGGNSDLDPETSRNYSIGIVLTPAWLDGFSAMIDAYRIKVRDTITSLGSQRILDLCANTGDKCGLITRAPTGEILNLTDGPVNLNTTLIKGIDFTLRYQTRETNIGAFTFVVDAAYLGTFRDELVNDDGSITVQKREGTSNVRRESLPEWRGRASARWNRGPWGAVYAVRLIGSTDEDPDDPDAGDIPAVTYHDLSASYTLDAPQITFTLGVENIFDKQPPASLINTNINFDINTYNPKGTFFYTRIGARF